MIIWGKKYVYSRLGYIADFCHLCREVRAFELTRVGLAGHFYYISLTQGDLVGHERKCTTCGTEFNCKPEIYARPSKEQLPLRELIRLTFPNLAAYHAARFALEKAIRDPFRKISAADRLALIKEPFNLLSTKAEAHFRASFFDHQSIAAFMLALMVGGFVVAGLLAFLPDYEAAFMVGDLMVACVAAWAWSFWTRRKFVRRAIVAPLASALHPLKPTHDEIAGVLKDMKALGLRIGSRVKTDAVMAALQTYVPAKAA
jgi:hypothetical protein